MEEVVFITERNNEGKYVATQPDANITQEATTVKELRDAITGLYREMAKPMLVRLYFIKDKYDITFYTRTDSLPGFYL